MIFRCYIWDTERRCVSCVEARQSKLQRYHAEAKQVSPATSCCCVNAARYGQPEEVAGLVRFLASDPAAAYITGQVSAAPNAVADPERQI